MRSTNKLKKFVIHQISRYYCNAGYSNGGCRMKFYNREQEIKTLKDIAQKAQKNSQFTFITGRRRIGKTRLLLNAYDGNLIYLFVSKKSESLLCQEFITQIQTSLKINILGDFTRFPALFEYLLDLAKTKHFTLVIDEFQEFYAVNPAIYADLQHIWDRYKDETKLNLVVSGSIYSLMHKIFEQAKEPLYGRATKKMVLKSFTIETLHKIFKENSAKLSPETMLAFYAVTGGVAKYVEILVDNQAFTFNKILKVFFENSSIFIHEGKDILIEEFGKDYTTYFSILSLIASSKTSRSEIESILGKSVGGYLDRLEHSYSLIKTVKPILSKPNARTQKYLIEDNFLNFWFRFIYKYQSAIEIENFDYVKAIIKDDFNSYAGRILEKYFIEALKQTRQFNRIGQYWESGNKNEIDIVAINERERFALIAEVKISDKRINLNLLEKKAQNLVKKFSNYEIIYKGYSINHIFAKSLL